MTVVIEILSGWPVEKISNLRMSNDETLSKAYDYKAEQLKLVNIRPIEMKQISPV